MAIQCALYRLILLLKRARMDGEQRSNIGPRAIFEEEIFSFAHMIPSMFLEEKSAGREISVEEK